MGQDCCLKLSSRQPQPEAKTELLPRTIILKQMTGNEAEFTFFLGVFELLRLGQQLKTPEFIDEMHPDFSYHKFNTAYKQYYRQVIALGKYVDTRRNPNSPLASRLKQDRLKVASATKRDSKEGCLIKLQIQGVIAEGVVDLGVILTHPDNLGNNQKWIKRKNLQNAVAYLEFVVPDASKSTLSIQGKPGNFQISINISESIQKVLKWKRGDQGVAIRAEIVGNDAEEDEQRLLEMQQLHNSLAADFGQGMSLIEGESNEIQVAQRLSRHRSSLHQKYNLRNEHL